MRSAAKTRTLPYFLQGLSLGVGTLDTPTPEEARKEHKVTIELIDKQQLIHNTCNNDEMFDLYRKSQDAAKMFDLFAAEIEKMQPIEKRDEWMRGIIYSLCQLGYPHNFQRERSYIAEYMRDISAIIKMAMEHTEEVMHRENGGTPT